MEKLRLLVSGELMPDANEVREKINEVIDELHFLNDRLRFTRGKEAPPSN